MDDLETLAETRESLTVWLAVPVDVQLPSAPSCCPQTREGERERKEWLESLSQEHGSAAIHAAIEALPRDPRTLEDGTRVQICAASAYWTKVLVWPFGKKSLRFIEVMRRHRLGVEAAGRE